MSAKKSIRSLEEFLVEKKQRRSEWWKIGPKVKINARRIAMRCPNRAEEIPASGTASWGTEGLLPLSRTGTQCAVHVPSGLSQLALLSKSPGASNPAVLKVWSHSSRISISWEPVSKTKPQALPRLIQSDTLGVGPAICASTSPAGESDALESLRTADWLEGHRSQRPYHPQAAY